MGAIESSAAATSIERDLPHCLYAATAASAVATPPLASTSRAAVVVVGAGYTGLSAALHLAERGVEVVVLEQHEPGWGAAGRNGGQVNAGLKHEPDTIERDLGPEHGARLIRLASEAPDYLFRLIDRCGIDCEAERGGTLRAAYHESQLGALRESMSQWRARGEALKLLGATTTATMTGTGRYVDALLDPRGGSVNPLSLARGLAAAAQRAGARIHGGTRALAIDRVGAGWSVGTAFGAVSADRVIIATDGYSGSLWPRLAQSVVPVYSAIAATEPLPAAMAAVVMPTRAVLYEVGAITAYYRRDTGGRLLMGGRGVQRAAPSLSDYAHLTRYAERLWPVLRGVTWTHWWNGQFALTPDFYPRLHAPVPGVFIAHGYSGRGIALATSVGRELAALATGAPLADAALPVTPIRAIPLHRFWRIGVSTRVTIGRLRDRFGC